PEFDEWLVTQRERLRAMMRDGLARLVALDAQAGHLARALDPARRGPPLDPLDEGMPRGGVGFEAPAGRPPGRPRQCRICCDALQRELGVEPDAETRALYSALLERRLPGRREAPATALASDIPLVGREAEAACLRDALEECVRGRGRVAAILGEAGIGKSRL